MDKIFICTEDTSNKFWGYKVNGLTVTCKWGRLGTAGQSKDFKFKNQMDLDEFVEDKTEEKLGKGYDERSPEQLELETAVAQTIGVGNKVERIHFVQLHESRGRKSITILDPKRDRKILHDPNIQPMVYAQISGRRKDKDSYEIPVKEFLLTLNEAKVVKTGSTSTVADWSGKYDDHEVRIVESELPASIDDGIDAMAKAVGACIGKLLL